MSLTGYIHSQSEGRRVEAGQTVAHLTSEVIDTLARLQDGNLHVLCGFFGMSRLLLQSNKGE